MREQRAATRYRFGIFEVDSGSGELRRQGLRVKLHSQPFAVLLLLLEKPGELLTREEICRELWPDGTFVDYDHGLNSAVNRIREALGDRASSPRFIETVARRGYRFVAPVERIVPQEVDASADFLPAENQDQSPAAPEQAEERFLDGVLAGPEDLPKSSHSVVQALFLLLQLMYLSFYVGALANLAEINDLLAALPYATEIFVALVVTAAILIPVRTFLICAVVFHAPRLREKFLKLWRFLLPLDILWSLSPFLLLHHINYGLALACMTLLVYSPFAQRSLILMGAGVVNAASQPPANG
jgi:cholera toxin transcriptional activator